MREGAHSNGAAQLVCERDRRSSKANSCTLKAATAIKACQKAADFVVPSALPAAQRIEASGLLVQRLWVRFPPTTFCQSSLHGGPTLGSQPLEGVRGSTHIGHTVPLHSTKFHPSEMRPLRAPLELHFQGSPIQLFWTAI